MSFLYNHVPNDFIDIAIASMYVICVKMGGSTFQTTSRRLQVNIRFTHEAENLQPNSARTVRAMVRAKRLLLAAAVGMDGTGVSCLRHGLQATIDFIDPNSRPAE